MKPLILIIFISFSTAIAANCDINKIDLASKFDSERLLRINLENASSELQELERCENITDEEKAFLKFLIGNIYLNEFKKSNLTKHAIKAMENYIGSTHYSNTYLLRSKFELAHLMLLWNKHNKATKYINEAIKIKPDDRGVLSLALIITAKSKNWKEAKTHIKSLMKVYDLYYFDAPLLKASVEVACHFNDYQSAKNMVSNVTQYIETRPVYKNSLTKYQIDTIEKATNLSKDCNKYENK